MPQQKLKAGLLNLPTLDILLKYFPLLGLGLIAIGLIDSVLYYTNFDINIVSYLDVSEVIFLPVDRIIAIVSVLIILFNGFIPILRIIDSHLQNLNPRILFLYKFIAVSILTTLSILFNSFDNGTSKEIQYDVLYVILYSLNISIIASALSTYVSRDNIIIYCFIFFSLLFFKGRTSLKSANIEKYGAKYSVSLTLSNGNEVISNKSFVFIGKTKNYYFFRLLKPLNKTVVIPMSDIRQERIYKLRDNI